MRARQIYLLGFFTVAALMSYSVYLQFYQGFEPCPLCTMQRVCFVLVGIAFFIGAVVCRLTFCRLVTNLLIILFSGAGFFFAARQAWLQYYPNAQSAECGVSLEYMMQVLPWHEVAGRVLAGSAECTAKTWSFFALSMPEWAMIWFAGFAFVGLRLLTKKVKR